MFATSGELFMIVRILDKGNKVCASLFSFSAIFLCETVLSKILQIFFFCNFLW